MSIASCHGRAGCLLHGTIAAIGEVGYQRTTVQEVCRRAGLSAGATFRQFDTRLDLIVRTVYAAHASTPPAPS
ncbi:helix-turn-helix domain-containing protein [Nocardia sp. NPDC059239]|uniref:helix-turn-helix domain-containing protein n=1 Tax=Nocardia sp. NPDC059239 TaxID=3346785 RepID=UPI0036AD0992